MPRFKVVRVRRVSAQVWRYAVHDRVLHRFATFGASEGHRETAHFAESKMTEEPERIDWYLWTNEEGYL